MPPKLVGRAMTHDLIVVSDLGGLVQRISKSGDLVWQRKLGMPRGIDIGNGQLIIGDGHTLRVMDISTGADLKIFNLDFPVLMMRLVDSDLYLLMNFNGKGAVRHYTFSQGGLEFVKSADVETSYARGLHVDKFGIYVADTFNHRIIILDLDSMKIKDQTDSYFPSSVQINGGDRLLVAEEHFNVVSEFSINPLKFSRILFGCKNNSRTMMLSIESDLDAKCKKDDFGNGFSGNLFSPNDAVELHGRIYVSDTDNHRVVEIYGGRVISQLTGFNNPVNVRAIGH
jgi:hypothetical protein